MCPGLNVGRRINLMLNSAKHLAPHASYALGENMCPRGTVATLNIPSTIPPTIGSGRTHVLSERILIIAFFARKFAERSKNRIYQNYILSN